MGPVGRIPSLTKEAPVVVVEMAGEMVVVRRQAAGVQTLLRTGCTYTSGSPAREECIK